MGRKSKISFEVKLKAVLEYKNGSESHYSLAKKYGVGRSSVQRWIMIYVTRGRAIFVTFVIDTLTKIC